MRFNKEQKKIIKKFLKEVSMFKKNKPSTKGGKNDGKK
jgi:hypothetical protein